MLDEVYREPTADLLVGLPIIPRRDAPDPRVAREGVVDEDIRRFSSEGHERGGVQLLQRRVSFDT